MDAIEERGKQRQKLLEHISIQLMEWSQQQHDCEDEDGQEVGQFPPLKGVPPQNDLLPSSHTTLNKHVTFNDLNMPDDERGAVGGSTLPMAGVLLGPQEGDPYNLKHYEPYCAKKALKIAK